MPKRTPLATTLAKRRLHSMATLIAMATTTTSLPQPAGRPMADYSSIDLADCTEFRQTLQARAPAVVHGTTWLLVTLLGTALVWAALTKADLVVQASGRVRSV